jgi:murein DD-endopeptidase MepM/ murein hydrolase activator NlpD
MRWLQFFGWIAVAWAQSASISPQQPKQGEVLFVRSGEATKARMLGQTIALFPQEDGKPLGLMPVPTLTKPGSYPLELLDKSGKVVEKMDVVVQDAHYARQNIAIEKSVATLKPSPGEQETVGEFRKEVSATRYWKEPLELPVTGCLTSPFGVQRYYNGKPTGDFHAGLDQRGAEGTPIHAVTGGVVKIVRQFNLRGGTVAIDHGQGLQSIYMHQSKLAAKEGDHVEAGDVIGYVGATGRATGAHLHWTLYANGVPVNPGQWLKAPAACEPRPETPAKKPTPHHAHATSGTDPHP